jgi:hypothetical protein
MRMAYCYLNTDSLRRRDSKAVEGYRTPRRFAFTSASEHAAASWSAPALWRFVAVFT